MPQSIHARENPAGPYGAWPILRSQPFQEDEGDQRRVEWVWQLWRSQDMLLASRDRQIEENIRMLAGRQWSVWSRLLGRFLDLNELLDNKERLWRRRPVFNHLLDWFLLTHARLTENPPIIAFQPSTQDRLDAQLAEVMDVVMKSLWQDTQMLEVIDRAAQILIPSGRVHLVSRVDPLQGEVVEWRGPALIQDPFDPDGGARIFPDVPFGQNGDPMLEITGPGDDDWQITGKAYAEHEGGIVVDPVSPLAVRGQWGHDVPWHRKRWHIRRQFLTPEEVFDAYGVEVEPDVRGEDVHRIGELRRMMFGTGNFGSAEWSEKSLATGETEGASGYVDVLELWHSPANFPGMLESEDEPGGRLLTVTRKKCLRDGSRPAKFQYTSPIRSIDFVGIPGRPSGTSPQESMNALQRAYNRQWSQVLEHSNKSANPIGFADQTLGLKQGDITNEPGQIHYVNRRFSSGNVPALEFAKPPPLGEIVYRALTMTKEELRDRGSMEGALGRPPTRDPSGELVKELRFNSDRYIGPAARRFTIALGRMVEDWMAILPTIWTADKVVTWAGEDQLLRTVVVQRHLFEEGSVNVVPDIESQLPEGRGERQARVRADWQAGAFGDPMSPEAIRHYLELARYPHLGRAHRPGGIHRVMAERENGKLAQGFAAAEIPVFEWQDHEVHLAVLEEFMSSPEYQDLAVEIQQEFVLHREDTLFALEEKLALDAQREARVMAQQAQTQAAAAGEVEDTLRQIEPGPPETSDSTAAPQGRPPGQPPVPRRGAVA
jgi:hypothetical protein